MSDMHEHFRAAQAAYLEQLQEAATDRPAHRQYISDVLDAPRGAEPEPARGVSAKVAQAIADDLFWITADPPQPGSQVNPYPAAYTRLRVEASRTTAQRARTQEHNDVWSGLKLED